MIGTWLDIVSTAGQSTTLLTVAICTYLSLIAMTAVVATLHPDPAYRADDRQTLALLVGVRNAR